MFDLCLHMRPILLGVLLGLAGSSFLASESRASVIYDITLFDAVGGTVGTGSLDFAGDLSTDGTFTIGANDLVDFSLTYTGPPGPDVSIVFADLRTGFSSPAFNYAVAAGELVMIDLDMPAAPLIANGACFACTFELGNITSGITTSAFFLFDLSDSSPLTSNNTYVLSRALVAVPEPGTLALFSFGLGALVFLRKGRRWSELRARAVASRIRLLVRSPTLRAPNYATA